MAEILLKEHSPKTERKNIKIIERNRLTKICPLFISRDISATIR